MRHKKGSSLALEVWRVWSLFQMLMFRKIFDPFSCQIQQVFLIPSFFLLLSQSQFLCVWPAMACLLTAPFIGFLQVLQTVRRGPSDAERIPARCTDSGRATTNDMGRVLQRFRGSSKAWYGIYGNGSDDKTYHYPFLLLPYLFWDEDAEN